MATDPYAQADQASNSQGSASTNSTGTAQAANPNVNVNNPFATQSEGAAAAGSGGQWDPRVNFALLEGRMVIMVPKQYTSDAPVPKDFNPKPGETREEWRVDLVVLDGESFSFEYNFRASKDADPEKRTQNVTEFPSMHRSQTVAQGQLVRALKGADKDGKFLYGVMTKVAQLRDVKLYPTPEALAAARTQWIADLQAGKPTTEPRYTWGLDDRPNVLTPARLQLAADWWTAYKAENFANAS